VPLPTRVLDVENGVRLIETNGEHGKYISLSHCWGNERDNFESKTKRDNLNSHKIGISFKKLPKTFRDAISFTRSLDYRYIWIDSLWQVIPRLEIVQLL